MELREVVEARRSTRAFSDRPVEPAKIERMLEAARWAPSCGNRQPWRFVVVGKDDPARPGVEKALDPGNGWARRAPVLIVAGARRDDGAVVEGRAYYLYDTGLATMSLVLRAADQGLVAHPMAGWKAKPLSAAVGAPEDFEPVAVVAVGYAGDPRDLDEPTRAKDERPRRRRDLEEIAFAGRWGEPFRAALPRAPARVYETDIPLRFADIDAMGHVNNAVTLTLLETGRVRFFHEVMGAQGIRDIDFILAEARVRYRRPILLQDRVRLRMHVTDLSRSSFRFRCELFDPRDGRVFTEAETVQVAYDYAAGRPRPLSPSFVERIREYVGG